MIVSSVGSHDQVSSLQTTSIRVLHSQSDRYVMAIGAKITENFPKNSRNSACAVSTLAHNTRMGTITQMTQNSATIMNARAHENKRSVRQILKMCKTFLRLNYQRLPVREIGLKSEKADFGHFSQN